MSTLPSQSMPRPQSSGSLDGDKPARALYLGERTPVFGLFHPPAENQRRERAILLCPPFGWEDICSYRSRRDWAIHLVSTGYPVLRIDLPGTGDSAGSPQDPDRLGAWTEAVDAAASWLGATSGCETIVAIGIGLSGLAICRAIAAGTPIDEVVLWAVPSQGRTLVRELRAFASLEESLFTIPSEPPSSSLADGDSAPGGFLLSAETTQALKEFDVTTLSFPEDRARRILLLDRDGIEVDARLRQHFEQTGATVTVAPGNGYGAMMAEPQDARPPTELFALLDSWLDEGASSAGGRPSGAAQATGPARKRMRTTEPRTAIELPFANTHVRETPMNIEQPHVRLFGILVEPVDPPASDLCAVLLNAGAVRRIGPNRMWVEIARRWAARGVPTLRLDIEGIGDADGDADRFTELAEFYVPELVGQVRETLDVLQQRGLGDRFVLAGLCSGAYWSFHAALQDERVTAAFMLNPRALFWDPSLETIRDLRRGLLNSSSWRKALRGEVSPAEARALMRQAPQALTSLSRRALARGRARHVDGDELDHALDRLRDTDKRLLFVFSNEEPLHEELKREGRLSRSNRWPNLELDLIPGRHHTLRSIEAQRRAMEVFDRALEKELPALPEQ